jgi:hypothetical protein
MREAMNRRGAENAEGRIEDSARVGSFGKKCAEGREAEGRIEDRG